MWKYKQVAIPLNATPDQRQGHLDQMGNDGWELKTVHTGPGSRHEILVFAKQVHEEQKAPPASGPKPLNG
jgi:hypothetical protein